ncbi:thioredoxin domain-containing protein [Leptolyngbyaceae cyanobacterium JSC-12]|nr:thioredoxin domain-containing protein [Leptolyngbyaceae cyanobacterium JSC-12]
MLCDTESLILTQDTFQSEVLEAQMLVLADGWASWCMSFQKINLVIQDLAIALARCIKIGRLNIATAPSIAAYYGIRTVPTLLCFYRGQVVLCTVREISQSELIYKLAPFLAGSYSSGRLLACL